MAKHGPDETERVDAEYASHHLWASLATAWTPAVHSRTVLSAGAFSRRRAGAKIEGGAGAFETSDDRSFDFIGAKQDWTLEAGGRHVVKGGVELRRQHARYDYATESTFEPSDPGPGGNPSDRSFAIDLRPIGESWGAYVADRIRITPSLVGEVGLRWDKQFWIEDNQVSPRVQLRWDSGEWVIRTAWGRYFQSQRLNELQVEDGVSTFYPAQSSEHWLASVERYFSSGPGVRVEAYLKEMDDLRPRWENLFNPLELFPEAQTDRVLVAPERGTARGIEVVAKGPSTRRVSWWASYGWAEAVDEIDGKRVPRNWDQRHTASVSVDFDLKGGWAVNLGAAWHSGWPATGVIAVPSGDPDKPEVELIAGERNGERLPAYLRFDARVSRSFATRAGEVTLIGEILNLANRDNACCVDDYAVRPLEDGTVAVVRDDRYWPPVTPTFAIRWRP
jgi:outer membrane receptor protein involved in Fe transport